MDLPITLIGFMGSGKSTIGKQLAREKGLSFIDLDKYIEERNGKSIPEIFRAEGEEGFRLIESQCLIEVLMEPNGVVALGGGTPCFKNNLEIIKTKSTSVYLKVSPEILAKRLSMSKNPRPLIEGKSNKELLEFISMLIGKREPYYLEADHIIQSDQIMTDDLLRLIFV